MSTHVMDTVAVEEHLPTGRRYLSSKPSGGYALIVTGRVFYDHVNGLRALPASAPKGYALVEFWEDFDWMQQHGVPVTRYADVNELLQVATAKVADARAAGIRSNMDLTSVYGIVVD